MSSSSVEYQCEVCNHIYVTDIHVTDIGITKCPRCGKQNNVTKENSKSTLEKPEIEDNDTSNNSVDKDQPISPRQPLTATQRLNYLQVTFLIVAAVFASIAVISFMIHVTSLAQDEQNPVKLSGSLEKGAYSEDYSFSGSVRWNGVGTLPTGYAIACALSLLGSAIIEVARATGGHK